MMNTNRDGYRKTELGWIPGDWKVFSLEELFTFKNGLNKEKEYFGKGTPIVNYVDVFKNRGLYSKDIKGLVEVSEQEKNNFAVKKGDVLFTRTSETIEEIGYTTVILDDVKDTVFSGFVLRARPRTNKLDELFCKYCFSGYRTRKEIKKKSSYTTRALTSGTLLNGVKICIPEHIGEQHKIGKIISEVEKEINYIDNHIIDLTELKRALIEQLMSKGIGHIEYKDTEIGKIPITWDILSLSEISIGGASYGIGAAAVAYNDYLPRYLRISDIDDNYALSNLDKKSVDNIASSDYVLEYGDIVFARTGNTTGKSYVYSEKDGELVYAGFLIRFRINQSKANVEFIKYIAQSKRYWNWVKTMSQRSGQPGINAKEYSLFVVPMPPLEEQNRIAAILMSFDQQILQYQQQKNDYIQLKRGLMQQLLTGKIRVRVDN